jgi:ferredoxin-NADP reductase
LNSKSIEERPKPAPMKRITLRLTDKRREYGEVCTYFFEPQEPLAYSAGQYVHVVLDLKDPEAKRVRELSFASAPHEPQIMFSVDGRSQSPFQQGLQALETGDTVQLFKTNQHMRWPVIEDAVVFIAGGIGITPFRSFCLDKVRSGVHMHTELIHVAGGPFLFADELRACVDRHVTTAREGFAEELAAAVERSPHARYYIAGSPGFVESVAAMLGEAGIQKIETDEFKGYIEDWQEQA